MENYTKEFANLKITHDEVEKAYELGLNERWTSTACVKTDTLFDNRRVYITDRSATWLNKNVQLSEEDIELEVLMYKCLDRAHQLKLNEWGNKMFIVYEDDEYVVAISTNFNFWVPHIYSFNIMKKPAKVSKTA